jgi:uncharacterized membrane protein
MEINVIKFLRIALIAFYGFAGSYHFIDPQFYFGLIPDYLPYPEFINYTSGILEILFAIGIAVPKTRLWAAKGLIILLLFFIPSHVYFITVGSCIENVLCVAPWFAWLRLLLIHPLLILWAWEVRKID